MHLFKSFNTETHLEKSTAYTSYSISCDAFHVPNLHADKFAISKQCYHSSCWWLISRSFKHRLSHIDAAIKQERQSLTVVVVFFFFFFPKSYSIYKKIQFFLTAFLDLFTHSQSVMVQKHHSEPVFKIHPPQLHSTQKNRLESRHWFLTENVNWFRGTNFQKKDVLLTHNQL